MRSRGGLSWFSLLLIVLLLGCSLDPRQLQLGDELAGSGGSVHALSGASFGGSASDGPAGSSGTASGSGGSLQTGGSGASAGTAGRPPRLVDGCPDLDENGIADCKETLLQNGSFQSDTDHWTVETDSTLAWDQHNATSDLPSGSALVTGAGVVDMNSNIATLRAASQCLRVMGKQLVTVYANAFVETGQDPNGHAEVDVFFFDGADCGSGFSTSFATPEPLGPPIVDDWFVLKAGAVTGSNTQSVLVKIAVAKPVRASSFHARFDNVLLKIQAP